MLDGMKKWLADALKLPIIHRELEAMSNQIDLLSQQAEGLAQRLDGLRVEINTSETQAAAWQATLINQQLKFQTMIDQMDIILRNTAALSVNHGKLSTSIDRRNAAAIAALSVDVKKLTAVLLERTHATGHEQDR